MIAKPTLFRKILYSNYLFIIIGRVLTNTIIARGRGKNNTRTQRVRALFLLSPRAIILFVCTLSVVFLLLHVFDYFETFLKWIIFSIC